MNRLTKYEPNEMSMFPYKAKDEELSTELDIVHKLGMLEDIEDELGIDLITNHDDIVKKFKVIEIIKEKEPDISFLYRALDLNHYNSCVWKEQVLTQEKFNLLKEMLENV